MKVDLMRHIDYFAGVPIAFILTILLKIASLFSSTKKVKPKNILFIELSEMGSTILADPAMRKAQKVFDAELFFCIFSKNKESLFLLNTIKEENVFLIRSESIVSLFIDLFRFLSWTRKRRIDTVVDMELFSRCPAIMTGLSGAKNKVGFHSFYNEGLYRGDMLTHKVSYNSHMHIAKNFIALVNALIADNKEVPYSKTLIKDEEICLTKVFPSEEARNIVWEKVKNEYPAFGDGVDHIVLMNPNASDLLPQRRWPLDKFAKVIQMTLDYDPTAVVLITGSSEEAKEMQRLTLMVNNYRCINFTGKVEFKELPVLYSISSFMLTSDSGPGHFSAITELPTFILFGPETPVLYGSLGNSTPVYAGLACSPCVTAFNHRKTPCKDNVCLQIISEDVVFEKIKKHLKTGK